VKNPGCGREKKVTIDCGRENLSDLTNQKKERLPRIIETGKGNTPKKGSLPTKGEERGGEGNSYIHYKRATGEKKEGGPPVNI